MTLATNFRAFRHAVAIGVAISLIAWPTFACGQGIGREGGSMPREIMRARPAAAWDKPTLTIFANDAFAELEGERPDFAAATPRGGAGAATQTAGMASASGGGGFRWSSLISEETLTDEIKDMKSVVSQTVASQSDFKGGGYDKAREAFSTVALCFGVIADYDRDVRWKKDAETARDLFARVGFNCKVGTDQSFNESKLRAADLETLLEGGSPTARPDRDEDFRWSQVAGRPALMSRLESADGALAAASASKGDFDKAMERVLRDAEIVAVIGEVIQREEFEYHDDDTYKGYASGMRDAAIRVRDAAQKKDYDTARAALGELKKSCDACHGDYRS